MCIRTLINAMGYHVTPQFVLIFTCVVTGFYACKSDADCVKTSEYAAHCCRNSTGNSNLSCHNISSCVGHFCEADDECGQLCCISNHCEECPKCRAKRKCGRDKVCCGKKYGRCRSHCLGSPCRFRDECHYRTLCCISETCVNTGCGVHSSVFAYVLVSTVIGCLVLFTIFLLKFECKRKSIRRRTIAPANMETAFSLPTTNHRTNSSDRKSYTTSTSQKE